MKESGAACLRAEEPGSGPHSTAVQTWDPTSGALFRSPGLFSGPARPCLASRGLLEQTASLPRARLCALQPLTGLALVQGDVSVIQLKTEREMPRRGHATQGKCSLVPGTDTGTCSLSPPLGTCSGLLGSLGPRAQHDGRGFLPRTGL